MQTRTDWFKVITGKEELTAPKFKGMTQYCPSCKNPVGSDVEECKYKEHLHNYQEANQKILYGKHHTPAKAI